MSSGIVDRLLRGRGWVLCIGLLLVGVVFTNVRLLELDRGIAADTERAAELKRENGVLRMRAARLGSSERIQEVAAEQGLVMPQPGRVRYLRADRPADATLAAARISAPRPTSPPAASPEPGSPAGAPGVAQAPATGTPATGAGTMPAASTGAGTAGTTTSDASGTN